MLLAKVFKRRIFSCNFFAKKYTLRGLPSKVYRSHFNKRKIAAALSAKRNQQGNKIIATFELAVS